MAWRVESQGVGDEVEWERDNSKCWKSHTHIHTLAYTRTSVGSALECKEAAKGPINNPFNKIICTVRKINVEINLIKLL